jgi:hypothetical protein
VTQAAHSRATKTLSRVVDGTALGLRTAATSSKKATPKKIAVQIIAMTFMLRFSAFQRCVRRPSRCVVAF